MIFRTKKILFTFLSIMVGVFSLCAQAPLKGNPPAPGFRGPPPHVGLPIDQNAIPFVVLAMIFGIIMIKRRNNKISQLS